MVHEMPIPMVAVDPADIHHDLGNNSNKWVPKSKVNVHDDDVGYSADGVVGVVDCADGDGQFLMSLSANVLFHHSWGKIE